MKEHEVTLNEIEDVLEDEDGTPITLSVHNWLLHRKRVLLRKREQCEANNKEAEKKMLIQDALRSNSKQKILSLVALGDCLLKDQLTA